MTGKVNSTESDSVGGLAWRQPLERPACNMKVMDTGEQFQGETGRRQNREFWVYAGFLSLEPA